MDVLLITKRHKERKNRRETRKMFSLKMKWLFFVVTGHFEMSRDSFSSQNGGYGHHIMVTWPEALLSHTELPTH